MAIIVNTLAHHLMVIGPAPLRPSTLMPCHIPLLYCWSQLAEAIREKRRLRQRFNQYGGSVGGMAPTAARPYAAGANNGRRGEYGDNGAGGASRSTALGGAGERDKYAKWGSIS